MSLARDNVTERFDDFWNLDLEAEVTNWGF